ncbi:MAG: HutD/Ves family protein [Pseudobdellovibrionaceae bacterium]
MIQLIKSSAYKVMPWKNGQGVTSQIDIFPEGSDFSRGDFLWRISSANLQASSEFSQFPGYSRYLAILKGEGLLLNERPLLQGDVLYFEGEEVISAKIIGNPVMDLGIIFRRDSVISSMSFEKLSPGTVTQLKLSKNIAYIFCKQSSFKLNEEKVEEGDCIKVVNEDTVEIVPAGVAEVQLYLIQIALR